MDEMGSDDLPMAVPIRPPTSETRTSAHNAEAHVLILRIGRGIHICNLHPYKRSPRSGKTMNHRALHNPVLYTFLSLDAADCYR